MSRLSTKQRRAVQRRKKSREAWHRQHGAYAHVWASRSWWWDRLIKRSFEAPMVHLAQRSDSMLRRWVS